MASGSDKEDRGNDILNDKLPPGRNPPRTFEFFNQNSSRAVCEKEFNKLPTQVQASLLIRIRDWSEHKPLTNKQFSPFKEAKYDNLYSLKYRWRDGTYRIIFLDDNNRGIGLTAFEKRSSSGKGAPKKIVERVNTRHQIYANRDHPVGKSS